MANYAISNVPRRVVYAGSGTGPYAFTFEILSAGDIAVYKGDTLLTLTTDYTVSINANGTGSVTLTTSAGTNNITIVGSKTIQRTTDFTTGGDFFANTLNDELDAQTIFIQQIAETAERGLKAPVTDPTDINMTLPRRGDRANKFLAFDAQGNPVPGETPPEIEAIYDNLGAVVALGSDLAGAGFTNDLGLITQPTDDNPAAPNGYIISVYENLDEIQAVNDNEANINTVAGNITGINGIAANLAEILQADTNAANAASSASAAASSASTATTQAGIATTQANNASSYATSALGYRNDASASATAASGSASSASSSASSASNSATTATTQAGIATTKASEASASASAASSSASSASGSASTATTQAGIATTKASEASASATAAAGSASSASSSASSAASAQAAAEAARDATLTAFDNFDDRYLGAKTSDPTVDNDGNALVAGALYYSTTLPGMKVYTGSAWVAAYVSGNDFLAKANNLSDLPSASTARSNLGVTATGADTTYAYRANNLSDLANAGTARTNLGLGSLAVKNTVATADIDNSAVTTAKIANDAITSEKLAPTLDLGSIA